MERHEAIQKRVRILGSRNASHHCVESKSSAHVLCDWGDDKRVFLFSALTRQLESQSYNASHAIA